MPIKRFDPKGDRVSVAQLLGDIDAFLRELKAAHIELPPALARLQLKAEAACAVLVKLLCKDKGGPCPTGLPRR
jgi:hypothetical protein